MKNRNCPNCAAPLEFGEYKCPYCGTLYLDLTMIDFDNKTPFFLTIKQNGMLITQKVKPETADMTITSEPVYAMGKNQKMLSIISSVNAETNIQFIAIPMGKDKVYAEMRKIEDD